MAAVDKDEDLEVALDTDEDSLTDSMAATALDTDKDSLTHFIQELKKYATIVWQKADELAIKVAYNAGIHVKQAALTGIQAGQVAFEAFTKRLTNWQEVPFNIAIVGSSGSGKSSFINAIRDLTADDEGGAAVDVTECTTEPTPYCHPKNNNLKLWDLPGVGTPNFPKNSEYLERVKFERYDFFLIFSVNRFTEEDCWLAEQIRSKGKKFFFVRAKIDADIQNDKRAHPKTSTEEKVLEKVRKNTVSNLQSFGNPKVFLVSNYHRVGWDFPELCDQMIEHFSGEKQEAFILSLDGISKSIIQAKRRVLNQRTWIDATFPLVPTNKRISGLGVQVNEWIIKENVKFYRQQLGLSDEGLQELSLKIGDDEHYLQNDLVSKKALSQLSEEKMLQEIVCNADYGGFVREIGKKCSNIPVFGGITSYATTVRILHDIINEMEKEAEAVFDKVAKKMSENCLKELLN